jgi:hypothetical protein
MTTATGTIISKHNPGGLEHVAKNEIQKEKRKNIALATATILSGIAVQPKELADLVGVSPLPKGQQKPAKRRKPFALRLFGHGFFRWVHHTWRYKKQKALEPSFFPCC